MSRSPVPTRGRQRARSILAVGLLGALASPALPASPPTSLKLQVDTDGVYRVSLGELESAGLPIEDRDPRHLHLFRGPEPEHLHVSGEADGRWDDGDYVEFVGRRHLADDGASDRYTDVSTYYLGYDAERSPLRYRTARPDVPTASLPRPLAYPARLYLEKDVVSDRSNQSEEADDDFWYWRRISSLTQGGRYAVRVDLDAAVPGTPGHVRVALDGLSHLPVDPDHHALLEVNRNLIGDYRWDGQRRLRPSVELESGILKSGRNWIAIELPGDIESDGEVGLDAVLLNWIELEYWRRFVANDGRLQFHSPDDWPAEVRIEIEGLDGSGAVGYRDDGVRLELSPVAVAQGAVPTAAFEVGEAAGREYFVASSATIATPLSIEPDHRTDLRDGRHGADLLIVTHPRFEAELAPLVELRRRQGLRVEVARVDDVYDEFGGGRMQPEAIRRFVRHTVDHWQPPAPRYLLLVGDTTWDFKNARGDAPEVFVPSYYPHSEKFGTYASDAWFVDVEGDDWLPELAVGRLPVRTEAEARGLVAKLLAYDREEPGGWTRRAIFITSVEPHLRRHTEELIDEHLARGYDVVRIHPEEGDDLGGLKERIRAAWSDGGGLVYFIGHGGAYLWEIGPEGWRNEEFLMDFEDFAALPETARLPFVVSMSCYTNTFDNPSLESSLGESFVRTDGKGAIAVLSSSWRASTSAMMRLGQRMFSRLFDGDERRLGELVMDGIRVSDDADLMRSFVLLGDPSLELSLGLAGPAAR